MRISTLPRVFLSEDSKVKLEKKRVFDQIKSFFPFFTEKVSKEATLVGRIHAQLQRDAHEMLNQLKNLKETLKKELEYHHESHLWSSFEAVVNPLMREYGQIEKKMMEKPENIVNDTSAIKSYSDWIVKAKLWVTLCSRPNDRDGIIKAVIVHTMQMSDEIIDRDLKTLHDYKYHELLNIGLDFEEIEATSKKLDQGLAPHLEALRALKHNKPADLQLDHLSKWKAIVDESRAKHYNAALHVIDAIITTVAPTPIQEEELEHLKEIFERVAYLEEEMPIFLGHLNRVDLADDVARQMLEGQLIFLEEEVHKLNRDLRLTLSLSTESQPSFKPLPMPENTFEGGRNGRSGRSGLSPFCPLSPLSPLRPLCPFLYFLQ